MTLKKGIRLYLKHLPAESVIQKKKENTDCEDTGKVYEFYIGPLAHVPEKDMIFLHIPEMTHRDAEGRPKFKEQEKWINTILKEKNINAEDYWWSHWKFISGDEAEKFVNFLMSLNAYE